MIRRAVQHVMGQTAVFGVNAVVGLLVIRVLPVTEYAAVVTILFIQVAACVLADLGLSHIVISKLSSKSTDRAHWRAVIESAILQRNEFAFFTLPLVGVLGMFLLKDLSLPRISLISIFAIGVMTGLVQSSLNIRKAALNARHDNDALFRLGMFEGTLRVVLFPLILSSPTALMVLILNFIAVGCTLVLFSMQSFEVKPQAEVLQENYRDELRSKAIPLISSVVYALIQGQIAVLLLGLVGQPQMVAEAGALSRLAQVVNLFLVLNPFWVQPHFSKLETNSALLKSLIQVGVILVLFMSVVWASVIWLPNCWLWLIGDQYAHTSSLLQIAMGGILINAAFSVLYTVSVARGLVVGQHWAVSLSVGLQLFFILLFGIHSVENALILQLLPGLGGFLIQCLLIGRALGWKDGCLRVSK